MEESDCSKFVVSRVDSEKGHKLLISKKSRSDVQHHNHTQIICIIVVLKVLKLTTCVPCPSLFRRNEKF